MTKDYKNKIKYAEGNVNGRENYGSDNEVGYDNNLVMPEGGFDKYKK